MENQDGLKLNGTHQLLAYADDVNLLGGSIHTLKQNAEALVAATREIGLVFGFVSVTFQIRRMNKCNVTDRSDFFFRFW